MNGATRNILLALLLGFVCSAVLAVIFPLASAILSAARSTPETGGIAAVAGGVSESSLLLLLFLWPLLALAFFFLLQRRRGRRRSGTD
jgi:uncharacterized BrkB/YihY/UPF0761 family membrane protein